MQYGFNVYLYLTFIDNDKPNYNDLLALLYDLKSPDSELPIKTIPLENKILSVQNIIDKREVGINC